MDFAIFSMFEKMFTFLYENTHTHKSLEAPI